MENNIACPNCGTSINVSDILYHQVEEKLQKEFEARKSKADKEAKEQLDAIKAEKDKLEKDKEALKEQVDKEVKSKLAIEKTAIEKSLREKISGESEEQLKSLQKELNEKSAQVKELNRTKAEVEKLKRDKEELKEQIELEKEREFSEKLKEEKAKIKKQAEESSAMKIKELEKQLEDQKELAEEMKRKAEQGSIQLQGEVQEIILKEVLTSLFPFDLIEEVGKGIRGADVIHKVRNKIGGECGSILYESKRTKSFSNDWIGKLKADAVLAKADLCIIVTEALPDGMDKIGHKDGVWICTFQDFRGLALALREGLIRISEAYSNQSNKGEKMQMLYDYLTGNEFRLQIGAIIEGFSDLQKSYLQERNAMEKIWKQREKQLQKVLLNTNHFIGSIKGIAGSSIPDLKQIGMGDEVFELNSEK